MTPNEIAEAARALVKEKPEFEKPMRDVWELIQDEIEALANKSPKKFKLYQVHAISRAARLELLTAFIEGCSVEICAERARKKVELAT